MGSNRIVSLPDQGEVRFYEDKDNGSSFVALKGPDAAVSNVTLKLPNGTGANGEVLASDGLGGTAWQSRSDWIPVGDTEIDGSLLISGPSPWFDVKAYGATGNGTDDDTDAIQDTLDAASVSGGSVLFPAGTYRVVGRLFYKSLSAVKIFGEGKSSKIVWVPPAPLSFSVSAATNASPIEITTTTSHGYGHGDWVYISGVTGNTAANGNWIITVVDTEKFTLTGSTGNGAYAGGGTTRAHKQWSLLGIAGTGSSDAYHCQGVQIRDLSFDFGGSRAAGYAEYYRGLNIFNADNIEINGCYLKGCRAEMVGLGNFGLPATPGNNAFIHDNFITDFAQDGVNPNVFNAIVSRNILTVGGTGIEAGRGSFTAAHNIFDDLNGCGIKIASVVGFNVSNNRFNNCLNDGTGLSSAVGSVYVMEQGSGTLSSDGIISGNVIINPTRHTFQVGVCVASSSAKPQRIQVSGNVVYGPQQGIFVTNADYISVSGNYVYPSGGSTGIAVLTGTTYCGVINNTVPGSWTNVPIEVDSAVSNYLFGNKTTIDGFTIAQRQAFTGLTVSQSGAAIAHSITQPGNYRGFQVVKSGTGAAESGYFETAGTDASVEVKTTNAAGLGFKVTKTGAGAGALVTLANSGTGNDVTANSWSVSAAGEANFTGGYRQTIDGWFYNNIPGTQAATTMSRLTADAGATYFYAMRAGSITGVSIVSNAARSGGTATAEVYLNDASTGLTAQLNGTNTVSAVATAAKDTYAFVAGDRLQVRLTTSSWTPTTADVRGSMEIET